MQEGEIKKSTQPSTRKRKIATGLFLIKFFFDKQETKQIDTHKRHFF